ncbi:MAG: YobA family protein [Bacilli bacterium]|nr:YobA family protein [Bacilli bacterium]
MQKKIALIIIIIVLVLGIGSGVVYKIIEKDVTDRETFNFKTDTNGSNDTVSHDEHYFYGKIIEVSSSYIIVEPNEKEEERKSSDRFRIELKKDNTTYKIGTNVKITYVGDINESYPAQIGTTKIEIVSEE